ncbi:MAG TPA: carboxypeptidase-like regulatory domain-containing protein [Candidatus Ozemobacteraceae bacterium]|nr:carboxypeptidase-like regulatory domain-containing protein [Candidatus Ozemobacteraceae bacterium]
MIPAKRFPSGMGILLTCFLLILTLVGCEKGTLGLKGGSVSGVVLDSRTLAGVTGVSVTGISGDGDNKVTKFTQTDSRGSYYFNDMRTGEWILSYDKVGYETIAQDASSAVTVVVVNNEHRTVPDVRMIQDYANQYINVRGMLKDARNGTLISLGTAQFTFGTQVFNNRLPTDLQVGFAVSAQVGELNVTIKVANYETYTTTITGTTDIDLGVILLQPQTYKIVGVWKDVPGWVFKNAPDASIIAYSGNRVIATATGKLNAQSFEVAGIPMGTTVSLEAQINGYRMNGPVPIVPNSDFQGVIYQALSLKNNFSPILRDVRIVIIGSGINNGERVGAFCEETGTVWPTTTVTNSGLLTTTPRVVDLGTNQVPTGYEFTFRGYNVDDGTSGVETPLINDDGVDAQIVTIRVN